ncbi:hypothetical protein TTHERM_00727510 (macronuclear) [Tetrahymena thermophila SB210]|uniref:Uncharacterized protein n=1 Tax=Tetrahymena thermophila (strain SB210) TaxID=312017 RepID=I7M358_TETTS|nr:hypothetical protein TTHERM_00727510 [Tetrahymena thermophila SB210]EAS02391.1 hypothetical protein TTHERM_00727510 [Tetrahymena thermophila SB210]|eukprot:XP_001022636.1 hypothetical protein TTHERM_00727510 [Tetrahymena thermophila SB210]
MLGVQLGGSQISVGQTTINNLESEDFDIKKRMSLVFLATMAAESKIEDERLKLSENNQFYPEIAFNFLKNFSKHIKETQKTQSFFDFSISPNDVMEYSQINSYRSGYIPYSELLALLNFYSIEYTDKVLECIIKYYDQIGYTNGMCYDAFLKMTVSQSVPQAKMKVIKRKVIFETENVSQQPAQTQTVQSVKGKKGTLPPLSVIQSLVLIFDLECNLITFTEKEKLKLQHNPQQYTILNFFELIDVDKKGYLDFSAVFNFIKRTNNQMVPNQYLGLLRRMKKPEICETISFQDFKDFFSPVLPYFTPADSSQYDSVQLYHEVNRSTVADPNRSQLLNQTTSASNMNQSILQSQAAVTYNSRNPYENSNQKVYFKDKQGRIVEKNHPHEPVFIKENPHFTEILKSNINIVHHPNESNIYTLIPEQYFELAPLMNKPPLAATSPLPVAPPPSNIISTKNYQINYTDYQLPKVDPKDMTGVDPFFKRATSQRQFYSVEPKKNGIFDSVSGAKVLANPNAPTQKQSQQALLDIDLSKISDVNAKRIIQQQQEIIKQQQEQLQSQIQQQQMPLYNTTHVQQQQLGFQAGAPPSNMNLATVSGVNPQQQFQGYVPQQVSVNQQFQQLYNQSPIIQDIVQLRHTNTASYDPSEVFTTNAANNMRNTNVLQDSFNAKINPFNHNSLLPNQLKQSQKIIGSAPNVNNSFIVETIPFSTHQLQKSTIINPILMKAKSKSPNKKKIFDPYTDIISNAQLNDHSYRFSNSNPLFKS